MEAFPHPTAISRDSLPHMHATNKSSQQQTATSSSPAVNTAHTDALTFATTHAVIPARNPVADFPDRSSVSVLRSVAPLLLQHTAVRTLYKEGHPMRRDYEGQCTALQLRSL